MTVSITTFFGVLAALLLAGAVYVLGYRAWRRRERSREDQTFHASFGGSPVAAPANPYVEARKEFADRYGDLARGKRNWQLASLLLVVTTLVLGVSLAAVATQHQVQPWLVLGDLESGAIQVVGEIPTARPTDTMVRWHLEQWIRNARIVVADYRAQDQYNELAYATVQGQAQTALVQWHQANPPKERARRETVLVKNQEARVISQNSYHLRWSEVRYARSGPSRTTEHEAVVQVGVVPPKSDAERGVNPLGIRIVQLDW